MGEVFVNLYRHLLQSAKELDFYLLRTGDELFVRREVQKFRRYIPTAIQRELHGKETPLLGKVREESPYQTKRQKQEELKILRYKVRFQLFPEPEVSCAWLLRKAFSTGRTLRMKQQEEHAVEDENMDDEFLQSTFGALKQLNNRLYLMKGRHFVLRKASHIKYNIGQIFRHKRYGFRGVIVRHFPGCPTSKEWVKEWGPFENGTEQAFYITFIDTRDRPEALITLAAEENLEILFNETTPISHPKIDDIFQGFRFGHHIMKDELAAKFPEDW